MTAAPRAPNSNNNPDLTFRIVQRTLTVGVGSIGTLTLQRHSSITGTPIWTSSNTAVAVINPTGENTARIVGFAAGETTIMVSIGAHSASISILVERGNKSC